MEHLICTNCKAALPPDSRFCQYCGSTVSPAKTKQPIKVTVKKKSAAPDPVPVPAAPAQSPAVPAPAPVYIPEAPVATAEKPAKKRRWAWKIILFSVIGVILTAAYAWAPMHFVSSKPEQTETQPTVHVHSYTEKVTKPTCTARGYTTYTCECGVSYTGQFVAAAHKYQSFKCTVCGKSTKEPAGNHLADWIIKNGTWDEETGTYSYVDWQGKNDLHYTLSCDPENGNLLFAKIYTIDGKSSYTVLNHAKRTYSTYLGKHYVEGTVNVRLFPAIPLTFDESNCTEKEMTEVQKLAESSMMDIIDWFRGFLEKHDVGITMVDLGFDIA